jgi:hypothetical protein
MNRVLEEPDNVRVKGKCCPHMGIMMPPKEGVKMSYAFECSVPQHQPRDHRNCDDTPGVLDISII